MKEKHLRVIVYIAGFVGLYAFLAVRIFPMMNAVLNEKMDQETQDFNKHGDLYYFSCISDFKEDYPPKVRKYRHSKDNPELEAADILTYGDSFFDMIFTKSIPERLSDTLNKKVYSFVSQDPTQSNPFCLLNASSYQSDGRLKPFIYETVERNIPLKFSQSFATLCASNEKTGISRIYDDLLSVIFRHNAENLYEVMLKQSYFTKRIYSGIATFKFKTFGYISPLTSKYKTGENPWLFYDKEYGTDPGCFYYQYTDDEISVMADHIAELRNDLLEKYNLELLFMPIPNKYTLYHKFINNDPSNNFFPRLFAELDKRQVCYIDVYHEFKSSSDTLYFGTDTHWNSKGIDIALNLVLEKMDGYHSLSFNKFANTIDSTDHMD